MVQQSDLEERICCYFICCCCFHFSFPLLLGHTVFVFVCPPLLVAVLGALSSSVKMAPATAA
jgi:hypothetical protein